jgi:hypothetical protein
MGDATFLYPAKAAAGPCARLARCGGRGFRMRACRLVVYFNNYYNKNKNKIKEFIKRNYKSENKIKELFYL